MSQCTALFYSESSVEIRRCRRNFSGRWPVPCYTGFNCIYASSSTRVAAGDAVFTNLGLLFAVGVGVGLARENHGAAGLAALVGYLVTTRAVEAMLHAAPTLWLQAT